MLAPIAAGGRVVMLKHFDTIQVWSHILGIVVNHPQPLPKVDLVSDKSIVMRLSQKQEKSGCFYMSSPLVAVDDI